MADIGEKILARVERKFDRGANLFRARGAMASIALVFFENEREIIIDANAGIVELLKERNAEGEVYAVREDLGNGYQDSTDFVRVTSRDGVPTYMLRTHNDGIVIRASTGNIDD